MEPSSSNFIINSLDIMHGISKLPYIRAGINRLLYPQKYLRKGIVQVDKDSIMSDDDRRNETVLSFCELVFSYYGCLHLLDNVISKALWGHTSVSLIMDAINQRFNFVRKKKYATFHEVHEFFVNLKNKDDRVRILQLFQFSDKTIIEIRELLAEDDEYKYQLQESGNYSFDDEFWYLELSDYEWNYEEKVTPYTEDSHRSFIKLIKRGIYPPLFFAVQVFNLIIKSRLKNDQFLLDFAFVTRDEYKLNTLSLYDARKNVGLVYNHDDLLELIQNGHPFSDCKFAGWVDEWLNNFDPFVKIDELSNWINYETDNNAFLLYVMHKESRDNLTKDVFRFLLTRGWEIPNIDEYYGVDTQFLKDSIGNQLKQTAAVYSIIQEVIPEKSKTTINWWLSQTHYYTIFNKLVEYFTTKYISKDSVPVSNDTVVKPGINENVSIGSAIPNVETKHINTNNNDLSYLRVLDEKIPAYESERPSRRRECLEKLYFILIERDYIDDNTDKDLFLYRFTGLGEPYSKDQTIIWKGVDRLLGYIARCLFTYKNSGTEGLGKFGNLFEDEDGKHPYLPSAKHITLEEYHKNPDKRSYRQFKEAIEILQECGFVNVENTSPRGRK